MTDAERVLLEQLQGLEQKWRIGSRQCKDSRLLNGDMTLAAEAALVEAEAIYRECADDLAALLRALPQRPEPTEKGGDALANDSRMHLRQDQRVLPGASADGGVTHPPTNTSAITPEQQKAIRHRRELDGKCEWCGKEFHHSSNGGCDFTFKPSPVLSSPSAAPWQAQVSSILKTEHTPIAGHNERSWCNWCGAKWAKPDWRLDPQPPLFGHPENGCIAILATTGAAAPTGEAQKDGAKPDHDS